MSVILEAPDSVLIDRYDGKHLDPDTGGTVQCRLVRQHIQVVQCRLHNALFSYLLTENALGMYSMCSGTWAPGPNHLPPVL